MLRKKLLISWRNIFRRLLFLIIPAIAAIVIFVLPGKLIKVSQVICESQYGECPADITSELQTLGSKPISESKKEVQKILKDNLLISDYSMQYGFPDKLKVNILLKKPRYAILNKNSGKYLLVGGEGQILGTVTETSLPTVIQEGDTPNLIALELMEGVFAMYQVQSGELNDNSLTVELPTAVRVIFPLEESRDKDVLLGTLRLIYSQVTDRQIDLRFKNALLR